MEDEYGPKLGSKTHPMIPLKDNGFAQGGYIGKPEPMVMGRVYPASASRETIDALKALEKLDWPADLAVSAASGSSTTQPSPTPASEVCPTQFAILIDALREQTAAITKLVRSNEALILTMGQVEQEADPDAPQTHYLSGRKI